MKRILRKNRGWGAWVAGAVTSLVALSAFGQYTPTAVGPIAIPDYPTLPPAYPSTIKVKDLVGSLEKVTVTLNTFTHTYANDVKVMIVAPDGQAVVLMSDAGGGQPLGGVSLSFDDTKGITLPQYSAIASGAYKPANYGGVTFQDAPAPSGSTLAALLPSQPNGDWKLYVADTTLFNQGSIGSWTVNLYTTPTIALGATSVTIEEGKTGTIGVTVADSSTAANNLTLSAVAVNKTLIPTSGLTFTGSGNSRTLNIAPGYLQFGTTTVTVTVTDELGGKASADFTVTVNNVNARPEVVLSASSINVVAGNIATGLTAFVTDLDYPDPSTLVLSASSSDSGVVAPGGVNFGTTPPAARPFSIIPTTTTAGSATVTIAVTDGATNNSAPIVVNVSAPPQPLFANFSTITPDALGAGNSSIVVPTISGNIGKVVVALNGVRDLNPSGLVATLTTPHGDIVLMSGATGSARDIGQLTFADGATGTFPTVDVVTNVTLAPSSTLGTLAGKAANGTWTLKLQNAVGAQIAAGWQLKIYPAPTIGPIGTLRINEDGIGQATFTVGDLDGTVTGISAVVANTPTAGLATVTSATVSGLNAQVTIAGNLNKFGTNDVTVTATDNNGFTSTRTFTLEVAAVNDAPDISFIEKQITFAAQPLGPVSYTIADVDNNVDSLVMTATSDNPKVLPNANIVLTRSGGTATFTLFPIGTTAGQANVTITLSDGSLSDSSTFTLYVQEAANPLFVNNTPIVISPDSAAVPYASTNKVTGLVGKVAEVQVTLLNFSHQVPQDVNMILVGPNGHAVPLMAKVGGATEVGNLTLVFRDSATATIPAGSIASGVYDISVGSTPFTMPAPAPAGPYSPDFATAFNGTDANGDWLLYVADDAIGKSFGSINGGWVLSIRTSPFIPDIADQEMIENTPKRIEVIVGDNQPGVTFTVTATPADTTLILPIGVSETGATRTLSITNVPYHYGPTTVEVTATDNLGNTATKTFNLNVKRVDLPPVVSTIPNQTVPATTLVGPLTFTAWTPQFDKNPNTKIDVTSDNPTLIPSGNIYYSGPVVDPVTSINTFTLSLQPAGIQTGTAKIYVTVTDNYAQKTTISFTVTVEKSLVFAYEKPISIPLGLPIEGEATPYAAPIEVQGLEGVINDVRLTLVDFTHTYPDDVNVLLVAPDGTTAVRLMSHVGGSNDVENVRLTFSDAPSAGTLPDETLPEAPLTSGTYKPASYGAAVTLPAPAPQVAYKTSGMASFAGLNPNGQWKLYILDDAFPDGGSVSGGVLLYIETKPSFKGIATQSGQENVVWPVAVTVFNSSVAPADLVLNASASGQDPSGLVANMAFTGTGGTRTLWITNAPNQPSMAKAPDFTKNGKAKITITAAAPGGPSSSTSFDYTVAYVNQAPKFTQFPNGLQLIDESGTGLFTVKYLDVDSWITAAPLVYSGDTTLIPNKADNLKINGFATTAKNVEGTIVIEVNPVDYLFGTNTITVVLNDGTNVLGKGIWITNSFTVGVKSVLQDPTITDPGDVTVTAGQAGPTKSFKVDSKDVSADKLVVTAVSSKQSVIPNQYITLGGSGTDRTVKVKSVGTTTDSADITLTVTDPNGRSSTAVFNVTVNAASSTSKPSQFANTATLTINGDARANTYPSFISVPDGSLKGKVSKVTVMLDGLTHTSPANLDVMLVGPDSTTAVMLMSGAGDATAIGAPIRLTFDDAGSVLPLDVLTEGTYHPGSYTKRTLPDAPTTYSVDLSVFNGQVPTGVWRLYVYNRAGQGQILAGWTLNITTAPTLEITGTTPAPIVINENGSATVGLTIGDDYGTEAKDMTVTASTTNPLLLPTRLITQNDANALSQVWTLTPEMYQSGEATVSFMVTRKSDGATASATVVPAMVVNPVNVAPTFSRIPDVTMNANETASIQFLVSDGDTALQNLSIKATSEDQTIVKDVKLLFGGKTNQLIGLPATAVPQVSLLNLSILPELTGKGTTKVNLTVTDPQAVIGTNVVVGWFWLTVNEYKIPPVISTIPAQTVASGAAVDNIAFTVKSDAPGAVLTVAGVAAPAGLIESITATKGTGDNWTLRIAALDVITDENPKTATVTLTATDTTSGATATTSFVVTIIPKRERSYTNSTPISITDNSAGNPYPSTIKVEDLAGAIKDVTVTLNGYAHTFPSDSGVLLVTPNGQKIVLMNRAGQGGGPVTNLNLKFDQAAAAAIPGSSTLTSGSWKPADYRSGSYNFVAPAPAGPYLTSLAGLTGPASGTWSLYVMDDTLGDFGHIKGGWTLSITTQPIINGLTDQYVLEGKSVTQAFTIADDTRSSNPTYQVSGTSSDTAILPTSGITFGGSGTNRTVTVAPAKFGSNVTVTVFVTNGDGQTVNSAFDLDVGYNLTPPVIGAIDDASTPAGSIFATPVSITDAHTPANELKIGIDSSDKDVVPLTNIKRDGSTLKIWPAGNLTGSSTITLSVTNNDTLWTQESFLLTVTPSPVPLFANSGAITINDLARANPYPSSLEVSGLSGTITKATVTLSGLQHTFPQDISILLASPSGTNVILMSRAGGALAVSNVRITFDQTVATPVPQTGTLVDGTYMPSDYKSSDSFFSPAPAGPFYSKSLNDLIGTAPNGTWSLYVQDDASPDLGLITGGWTLALTTSAGKAVVIGSRSPSLSISQAAEGLRITVQGTPGVEYGIETSSDMRNWSEAGSAIADDNGTAQYTINPAQSGVQLFRAIAK